LTVVVHGVKTERRTGPSSVPSSAKTANSDTYFLIILAIIIQTGKSEFDIPYFIFSRNGKIRHAQKSNIWS
jgi:hypothetical protein